MCRFMLFGSGDRAILQHLNDPLRYCPGCMGTLLTTRIVESFVFVDIPHVVGAPRELLLQLAASDAVEFLAEALGEFLRLFEVIDVVPTV